MSQPQLHIDTVGQGQELVLLHGWGVNSAVFAPLRQALANYKVHYVDLPGFGDSASIEGDIHAWVDALSISIPNQAIWVGWSLGGLIATQMALNYPQQVQGLVTIASSPCFMARKSESWPGIPPHVLSEFTTQLDQDLEKTIERFLAIQAMGSATAKEDIKRLKHLVLAKPLPNSAALVQGLNMLKLVDIRQQLPQIDRPWLRIWGRLDGLVPRHVPPKMPQNEQLYQDLLLTKASHAPFISHPDEFLAGFVSWIEKTIAE